MEVIKKGKFKGIKTAPELKVTLIFHHQIRQFSDYKNGTDMMAVYAFYQMCAHIQHTNQIRANATFVKNGLKISLHRVKKAKANLKKMGLIDDIMIYDEKKNKITAWYIHLKFAPTNQTRSNAIASGSYSDPVGKKQVGLNPSRLDKDPRNALRNLKVNINALRKINNLKSKYHSFTDGKSYFHSELRFYLNIFGIMRNPVPKLKITDSKHPNNKFYLYISKRLAKINEEFYERKFKDSEKWTNDIRLLAQQDIGCNGTPTKAIKNRMRNVLKYHGQVIGNDFAHVLQSGKSFRKKFFDVEGAMKRKDSFNKSEDDNPHLDGSQFILKGF